MQIIYEPLFSERTTLRLGGKAIAEISLSEMVDDIVLINTLKELGNDVIVIGAGSNLLVSDTNINKVIIRPKFNRKPEIIERDINQSLITVGSGIRLPRFLAACTKFGLSGLEGLAGIPGTVGGAIAMNAGSFNSETCNCLYSLKIYSPSTGIITINRQDFSYNYRSFIIHNLKSWYVIIEATFILTHAEISAIKNLTSLNNFKKKSTQPVKAWSAGCVFKNPSHQQPAGMLLEQAGLKGKRLGGMAFSDIHANFLINEGKGSADAAFELLEIAREAVYERFGISLETEVKILCP